MLSTRCERTERARRSLTVVANRMSHPGTVGQPSDVIGSIDVFWQIQVEAMAFGWRLVR